MSTESANNLRNEYWAFISYRHADNQQVGRQWATWLHQRLESYEVPDDLIGTTNQRDEPIPERIFPVFRDEEELPADANLGSSVRSALERSKYLIVLCSPRAVESTYVGEEIAYFKKLGRTDRVIAVILEGEPNASWDIGKQKAGASPYQECFPAALMHPIDSDGNINTSVILEPIAADFRLVSDGQQGWTNPAAYRQVLDAQGTHRSKAIRDLVSDYDRKLSLGVNKVLAGVLGLPLGKLTQREKAFQLEKSRRRARSLTIWLSVSLFLAGIAAAGAAIAREQTIRAEHEAWIAKIKAFHSEKALDALKESLAQVGWKMYDIGWEKRIDLNQTGTCRLRVVKGIDYVFLAYPAEGDANLRQLDLRLIEDETGAVTNATVNQGPVGSVVFSPSVSGEVSLEVLPSQGFDTTLPCTVELWIGNAPPRSSPPFR